MKKFKLILMIAVAFMFAIASCQKNDDLFVNGNENETESISRNKDFRGDDDHISGIDPSPLISYLASLYGTWYYISSDSLYLAYPVDGFSGRAVTLWVFPSKLVDYMYFTVVINSSAQIKGAYILSYTIFQSDATESDYYEFQVYDPEGEAFPNCFSGYAVTNDYPYYNDTFTIYNSINIPSTYPYPLFDNITSGTVDLENCLFGGNYIPKVKIALRIGFTIYVNYCGS